MSDHIPFSRSAEKSPSEKPLYEASLETEGYLDPTVLNRLRRLEAEVKLQMHAMWLERTKRQLGSETFLFWFGGIAAITSAVFTAYHASIGSWKQAAFNLLFVTMNVYFTFVAYESRQKLKRKLDNQEPTP